MEPTGSTLGLLLVLVVVRGGAGAGAEAPVGTQDDAPSLCSIFSVSASGPLWYEFLGTINGTLFFKYSCKSQMAELVGPVGMKLNATKAWNQRCQHWMQLFPELRDALLHNQENISKAFGTDSLSLQGRMMCEQEFNGCRKTFWIFGFREQMCLRFDLKNTVWTELHPGCRSLKEELNNSSDIPRYLGWISNEHCVKLLNQCSVLDTKAAPATDSTTAPSKAKDNNTWNIPLIAILISLGILGSAWYIHKNRNAVQARLRAWSSSTRVPSGRPPVHHPQGPTHDHQELQPLQGMGRPAEDPDGPAPAVVTSSTL